MATISKVSASTNQKIDPNPAWNPALPGNFYALNGSCGKPEIAKQVSGCQ